MKKLFNGSIAALVIAGFAVKKFRKVVVVGIIAVTIVGFATFNMGLNLQGGSNLSAISLANIEVLADGEYSVSCTNCSESCAGFLPNGYPCCPCCSSAKSAICDSNGCRCQ
jgi:Zn finger protein HypA/HybF involved in hydrogenase expression